MDLTCLTKKVATRFAGRVKAGNSGKQPKANLIKEAIESGKAKKEKS